MMLENASETLKGKIRRAPNQQNLKSHSMLSISQRIAKVLRILNGPLSDRFVISAQIAKNTNVGCRKFKLLRRTMKRLAK